MSLTLKDIEILSAPFDEKTLGVKIQSTSRDKTRATLVCYLQHTDVYTRVEQVDPTWTVAVTEEKQIGEMFTTRVRLTVKGVQRENSGEGDTPKASLSDAIKRAAMLFGVGRYLYDMPVVWIPYNEATDKYRSWTYDDYKKNLRQDLPPAAQGPAPARQSPGTQSRPAPARASVRTRDQIAEEIMVAAAAIRLSDHEMSNWVYEMFRKTMKELTIAEMSEFLTTLQREQGRAS